MWNKLTSGIKRLWNGLIHFIKRTYRFVTQDLWRTTGEDFSGIKKFALSIIKTIDLSIRGFFDKDLSTKASALTYSMAFAVVPILALVLAIAKGFGFEQMIEEALNKSTISQIENVVPTIMEFVNRYLETAQGGTFIGIGLLVLLWAIYSFMSTIETYFNKIWQVAESRSHIRQITAYLAILIMIPILIVVSSGLNIYIHSVVNNSELAEAVKQSQHWIVKLLPYILSWTVFTFLYLLTPNTKVKFVSALIPGILIGTVFEIFQKLMIMGVVSLSRYNMVYGTFATIPILLFWMWITCLMILVGAEISYDVQNFDNHNYEKDIKHISRRYKDYITLYLTYLIIKRFEQGGEAYRTNELAKENHLPHRLVNQLLGRLSDPKVGILCEIVVAENEDKAYIPALDINHITVGMVFDRIDMQGSEGFLQKNALPQMMAFWNKWLSMKESNADTMNILVKDMMNENQTHKL